MQLLLILENHSLRLALTGIRVFSPHFPKLEMMEKDTGQPCGLRWAHPWPHPLGDTLQCLGFLDKNLSRRATQWFGRARMWITMFLVEELMIFPKCPEFREANSPLSLNDFVFNSFGIHT